MADPAPVLARCLPADAAAALPAMAAEVRRERARLPVLFPALPRRFGRQSLAGGRTQVGAATLELSALRACDAAAALLLLGAGPSESELWDLYAHGDIEERTMLLRALHVLPVTAATIRLYGEVQRTNMVVHDEAAVCDGDLLARAAGQHGFGPAEQNRLLLKVAFLDLPLARVYGAERLANPELSRMLQDLATEREAAGRPIWRDTDRLLGRAPVPGTAARILGGLEHGDDGRRLAAAEGLLALGRPELVPFARERLAREVRAEVRALLQEFLDRC